VDFDFDLATQVLHHPVREPEYRQGRSHRDFLITLNGLGVQGDRNTIENAAPTGERYTGAGMTNPTRIHSRLQLP
jgi:hypothetical protein